MKNLVRTLELTALIGLGAGCSNDELVKKTVFSGEDFQRAAATLARYSPRPKFYMHSESNWRNYPTCGTVSQLPRAEVRTYTSGKKVVDLYFRCD